MILSFLKQTLQPASITSLLLLLAVGVVLLYTRRPALARWGRRWLTAMLAGYWILSCPAGVALLAWTVTGPYGPLASAADARGAQAVVLLGAGSKNVRGAGGLLPMVTYPSALRVLETVRVYKLLGDPVVIVSGGTTDPVSGARPESEAMRIAAVALGVPADRIVGESESKNTHDEAVMVKRILRDRGIDRFVIVTSPVHMGRSLATFAAEGLHPVPSTAPLYQERDDGARLMPLMPNDTSFEIGNAVVYEWLALVYYWWNGWLEPQASE